MKLHKFDEFDRKAIKISIYAILSVTIIYMLSGIVNWIPNFLLGVLDFILYVLSILKPLWMALVMAYLLYPVVMWVERNLFKEIIKKKEKKNKVAEPVKEEKNKNARIVISILLTYIFIVLVITVIFISGFFMIKGKLDGTNFDAFISGVKNYMDETRGFLEKNLETRLDASNIFSPELKDKITDLASGVGNIGESILNFLISAINGIMNNLIGFLLALVLAFYIMADLQFFKKLYIEAQLLIMSKKHAEKVNNFILEVDNVVSKFIRGQLLDCSIVAVIAIIALSLIGLEFAFFVGLFLGIANIIPYFGAIFGGCVAVVVGLISSKPITALWALIAIVIIQQFDGNIMQPKIVGKSVGLHPLFILLAVIIGAQFGFLGLVLAVPTAGVLKLILIKLIEKKNIKID